MTTTGEMTDMERGRQRALEHMAGATPARRRELPDDPAEWTDYERGVARARQVLAGRGGRR